MNKLRLISHACILVGLFIFGFVTYQLHLRNGYIARIDGLPKQDRRFDHVEERWVVVVRSENPVEAMFRIAPPKSLALVFTPELAIEVEAVPSTASETTLPNVVSVLVRQQDTLNKNEVRVLSKIFLGCKYWDLPNLPTKESSLENLLRLFPKDSMVLVRSQPESEVGERKKHAHATVVWMTANDRGK